MKAIRQILAKVKIADKQYSLIEDGDEIVVGVSGGKDSMALVYILSLYRRYSKKNFNVHPITIDMGFPTFNIDKNKEFIESLGLKLDIVQRTDIYEILTLNKEHDKLPCSICSKMRKALLDEYAKEHSFNKIALGHHLDDALETMWMNMIFGGRIATFSPYMHLSRDDVNYIRPMILVKEHQIKTMIEEEGIPVATSYCSNDKFTSREKMKEYLHEIYIDYPIAKQNFCHMLTDFEHRELWDDLRKENIEDTPLFLYNVSTPTLAKEESIILGKDLKDELIYDKKLHHHLIKDGDKPVGVFIYKEEKHKIEIKKIKFIRGYAKYKDKFDTFLNKKLIELYGDYEFVD